MKEIILSIGSYDGVHLGHQLIIEKMREISLIKKIETAILFFEVPPKLYLRSEFKNNLITLPIERISIIKEYGVDIIVPIEFNEKIHLMSPRDFFRKFVFSRYKVSDIVVGRDFAVGYNREGNIEWLKDFSLEMSFNISLVDFVKYYNHKISSSLIREFLKKGMIEHVNKLLGRFYTLEGIVKKGAGIGKKLGYPTANLEIDERKLLPLGIFIVDVFLKGKHFKGVASIGKRPTLKTLGNEIICEVHILDFSEDIYGEKVLISFFNKIRDEKKFDNVSLLIQQIKKDIDYTREYFRNIKNALKN
ncbi:MAG: bifunctional riboflavin kinase/FAD synthetase [Elusimicrobiales bacterium]|nr:bifunctional riboflavin kinase/FAD synthetase [Elusimicrobiales bacterium]